MAEIALRSACVGLHGVGATADINQIIMIGVIAKADDSPVVREFFELFKTPWEEYRPEGAYEVVVSCGGDEIPRDIAKVVVHYIASESLSDATKTVGDRNGGTLLSYRGQHIPIYGACSVFSGLDSDTIFLTEDIAGESVGYQSCRQGMRYCRIGYDLFGEIRTLLTSGQPPEHASIPTVELHIAILRDLIIEAGVTFVEVPPIPRGYSFIACLTHDVDHPSIRRHRWDHTAWGFLYRALLGSVVNLLRGRLSIGGLVANWAAAAKLPLVYLGLAKDFWLDFDRYLSFEQQAGSTFFVLPFEGTPGRAEKGSAPRIRASGYGAADIADQIRTIIKNGGEVGLHGIDAWIDSAQGQEEKTQIEQVTGSPIAGVRMHWLYFNAESPALLEKAGFAYDSTVGYNETIGYRAGTTQVYKPLNADHLLELPMHVMDTALFYPSHLGLSSEEAAQRVGTLIENAVTWGGGLTFNWHDRSIAPERCWDEFYAELLLNLKQQGAWCTSVGRAVAWFQERRSVRFKRIGQGIEVTGAIVEGGFNEGNSGLWLRIYNATDSETGSLKQYAEVLLTQGMEVSRSGAIARMDRR